jgi:hypothetical protein
MQSFSKYLKTNLLIVLIISLSFAQWSRTGTRVSLTNVGDSIVSNTNKIEFNNSSGSSSIIYLYPSTVGSDDLDVARGNSNRINIQTAIDKLRMVNGGGDGGTVVLMAGFYPLTIQTGQQYAIILRHGVKLQGVSSNATILTPIQSGSTGSLFSIIRADNIANSPSASVENLRIENRGNFTNIIGIDFATGIARSAVQPFTIKDVRIKNLTIGINIASWSGLVENATINGCGSGIKLRFVNDKTNNITISNSNIWTGTIITAQDAIAQDPNWNTDTCIVIDGTNNRIINCNFCPGTNGWGVFLVDSLARSNYIVANYFEMFQNSNPTGLFIPSSGNTINGNYFDWQTGREYSLTNAPTGNTLIGNLSTGHRTDGQIINLPDILGQNVGIQHNSPSFPLTIGGPGNGLGNKISLWDNGNGNGYGFGIQPGIFQMFSADSGTDITFGYGNSTNMKRKVTFTSTGCIGINTSSPKSGLHLSGGNAAITFSEQTSSPTVSPSSGNETQMYMKGDKLILRYMDGSTTRYKYMPLNGTSTTWVHTTTAP